MIVFGQSCCIRAKVVEFVQKWLYYGPSGCIQAKVVVLGNVALFGQIRLYSCKIVVFGQQ